MSIPHPVEARSPDRTPAAPAGPTPDVSVCVVNWNCRELLRGCLASLLHHEQGAHSEVIVVDNGSADGAADMVAHEFPEVVLIRNVSNAGFARANNQAARLARGRYLFFLNNDTLVPPETVGSLLDYAEAHPEVGILAPRLRDARGRVQLSCRTRPTVAALLHRICLLRWTGLLRRAYRRYRWREEELEQTREVEVVMGAAMLVRRDLFAWCGGWDEEYTFGGEDIDLCVRVATSHAIVFYPAAEVVHYGRVSSRLHAGYAHSNTLIGITRFLRKSGCSRWALFAYKLVVTIDAPLDWL
ncbi:MAG: glycosyltransferase family 2 protein, partial [Planctomycetes bacterium]|nr:glycosyltransferase family 2 protein [Planctomycetota bacterium]